MKSIIHYPNLRGLMAKHGITIEDLGKIMGRGYRQTWVKLNKSKTKNGKEATFSINEAKSITSFFNELEEKKQKDYKNILTIDEIFFDVTVTKVTN